MKSGRRQAQEIMRSFEKFDLLEIFCDILSYHLEREESRSQRKHGNKMCECGAVCAERLRSLIRFPQTRVVCHRNIQSQARLYEVFKK